MFDACLITADMKRPLSACVAIKNHVYIEKPSNEFSWRKDRVNNNGIATAGTKFNSDPYV